MQQLWNYLVIVLGFFYDCVFLSCVVQAQYQMHLAEMEAAREGMPVVCVTHEAGGGPAIRDIHMENFSISIGGRDLIVDGSVTLSFGRHYGGLSSLFKLHSTALMPRKEKKKIKKLQEDAYGIVFP